MDTAVRREAQRKHRSRNDPETAKESAGAKSEQSTSRARGRVVPPAYQSAMSSPEEALAPAFASGGAWKQAGAANDEDEDEFVAEPTTLEFTLSRSDDGNTITGLLLNATAVDISMDLHPVLSFAFSPVSSLLLRVRVLSVGISIAQQAELMKFEMPSTLTGKKSEAFRVAAKSSTAILNGALKPGSGRWVFNWKNDNATRTHACSYTTHPKGCEMTVTVTGVGVGPLVATLKV